MAGQAGHACPDRDDPVVATVSGDFELTMDEVRGVARFVVESAQQVLPVFEDAYPADPRPRAATDAA